MIIPAPRVRSNKMYYTTGTSISNSNLNLTVNSATTTYFSNTYTPENYFSNTYTPEKMTIKCNFPYQIKDVKEHVLDKVYEFTFYDDTKIKTICDEEDSFDLEYAFYLALAKKLYSDRYTFEGVIHKSYELQY